MSIIDDYEDSVNFDEPIQQQSFDDLVPQAMTEQVPVRGIQPVPEVQSFPKMLSKKQNKQLKEMTNYAPSDALEKDPSFIVKMFKGISIAFWWVWKLLFRIIWLLIIFGFTLVKTAVLGAKGV